MSRFTPALPPLPALSKGWRWSAVYAVTDGLTLSNLQSLSELLAPWSQSLPLSQFMAWNVLERNTLLIAGTASKSALRDSTWTSLFSQIIRPIRGKACDGPDHWIFCRTALNDPNHKEWVFTFYHADLKTWLCCDVSLQKRPHAQGLILAQFWKQTLTAQGARVSPLGAELLSSLPYWKIKAPKGFEMRAMNFAKVTRGAANKKVLSFDVHGKTSALRTLHSRDTKAMTLQPGPSTLSHLTKSWRAKTRRQLLKDLLVRQDIRQLFLPLLRSHTPSDLAGLSWEELFLALDLEDRTLVAVVDASLREAASIPALQLQQIHTMWKTICLAEEAYRHEAA